MEIRSFGFLKMLADMHIKEADENNCSWAKSSTSSGRSTPAERQSSPVKRRHITINTKNKPRENENNKVKENPRLPSAKHDEILKWSKSIPQTFDVEKKLKSTPKGGQSVKLYFLSNDGDLYAGGTSNLGKQGLKTSMPGGRTCRSADPRLTSSVPRRLETLGRASSSRRLENWSKDSIAPTQGKDPKISVNDMHHITQNLVDSSLYYSGERKNPEMETKSSQARTRNAWEKEQPQVGFDQRLSVEGTKENLRSGSHSVLGNMRQSQRSSGVVRPWTTSSRIGAHAECTRSLSNALLNVLTIDDCQLRHMYRERRLASSKSRGRVGSSQSRHRSRPPSGRTESGIFDLQSVSSGNKVRTAEQELAQHMLENAKADYDLPPELLLLLEEHVDFPSDAVRKGFEAILDQDVMNNTSRTGLYKYDKSCRRRLNVGKGTDFFMRMKAMLRYHMLVDESAPSRMRLNRALKMHLGERYQESIPESDGARLDNLTEVSDATE